MHEKALVSFYDITLLFLYEGLDKWSKVNDAMDHFNYFYLIELFAEEKVKVINDEENVKILLHKRFYTFTNFILDVRMYSKHLGFRIFCSFFFLFSTLKFTSLTLAMLENLCGNKRKNKSAKFSENLNALSRCRMRILTVWKRELQK
ncbi:MAG: hypothetical protein ACI9WL_001227 [Rubritalea sp.]|jgi:hypothetical protein